MKIILDTEAKQTICPPDFFDNIRKINDASELTGSKTKITPENYLEKMINECSEVIVNKNDIRKRRPVNKKKSINRSAFNDNVNSIGKITVEPMDN